MGAIEEISINLGGMRGGEQAWHGSGALCQRLPVPDGRRTPLQYLHNINLFIVDL